MKEKDGELIHHLTKLSLEQNLKEIDQIHLRGMLKKDIIAQGKTGMGSKPLDLELMYMKEIRE